MIENSPESIWNLIYLFVGLVYGYISAWNVYRKIQRPKGLKNKKIKRG